MSARKVFRLCIVPTSTVAGILASELLMPSPQELRRAGEIVDGTGYAFAALFGFILGALAGFIVVAVLDRTIWSPSADKDSGRPALKNQ